jgi:hypothetical protein
MTDEQIDAYMEYVHKRLTFLYRVGCQYDISQDDMADICKLCNLPFAALQDFNGTEAFIGVEA